MLASRSSLSQDPWVVTTTTQGSRFGVGLFCGQTNSGAVDSINTCCGVCDNSITLENGTARPPHSSFSGSSMQAESQAEPQNPAFGKWEGSR